MHRRMLFVCFLLLFAWINVVWAAPLPLPPQVGAEAAILYAPATKQILFGKKPDAIMYPASTTKIMTLITAIEAGKPDGIVTVSSKAANTEGSSLGLNAGDQLTLQNVMFGMMMVSGNDAAVAIAQNVAGSVPAFVDMMNANAAKIGATRTHFSNPNGLPDPINHYTTAHDLALIAAYALQNPLFAKIVSTPEYDVQFLNRPTMHVTNINRLLKTYPGADGVKTGYTHDAGDCLVAAAKRNGVQLIAVMLNDDQRWDDAVKLLDYGFQTLHVNRN
ncbi:peptidase s11 d-alanyl-d-alanine carboxypeptidase a [Lucifera butyrica]|uniref:Peptidase s11 d-alanyl-d-alanine carboxypeptidase a n=1 Tax=Lucifera butyrica TaxID=1351585 RepID=A0A498RCE3_9FIRM|nr:D-alanyl-D-alanine carboxypeptidase family protein [Lucifera butyrica]VBB09204.1 peptidase s11 d-alanyl-d-alanine carboxypeptidase a [Lucifera butyrica]